MSESDLFHHPDLPALPPPAEPVSNFYRVDPQFAREELGPRRPKPEPTPPLEEQTPPKESYADALRSRDRAMALKLIAKYAERMTRSTFLGKLDLPADATPDQIRRAVIITINELNTPLHGLTIPAKPHLVTNPETGQQVSQVTEQEKADDALRAQVSSYVGIMRQAFVDYRNQANERRAQRETDRTHQQELDRRFYDKLATITGYYFQPLGTLLAEYLQESPTPKTQLEADAEIIADIITNFFDGNYVANRIQNLNDVRVKTVATRIWEQSKRFRQETNLQLDQLLSKVIQEAITISRHDISLSYQNLSLVLDRAFNGLGSFFSFDRNILRLRVRAYIALVEATYTELAQANYTTLTTQFTKAELLTRVKNHIDQIGVEGAATITSILERWRQEFLQKAAITEAMAQIEPENGLADCINILTELAPNSITIANALNALKNLRDLFERAGKTQYFARSVNHPERIHLPNEEMYWREMYDASLRSKIRAAFDIFGQEQQTIWEQEIVALRQKLPAVAKERLHVAIPFHVERDLVAQPQLASLLGSARFNLLREQVTARVITTGEALLTSVDYDLLSGRHLESSLAFLQSDRRWNPELVGDGQPPVRYLQLDENDQIRSERDTNKLSLALFKILNKIAASARDEVSIMSKAVEFAAPTETISPPQLVQDLQKGYLVAGFHDSPAEVHQTKVIAYTQSLINVATARLLAAPTMTADNDQITKRRQMAQSLLLAQPAYLRVPEDYDQSLYDEAKQQATDYLVKIVGFDRPTVTEVVEKDLRLPKNQASLITLAAQGLMNPDGQIELIHPQLMTAAVTETKPERRGFISNIEDILGHTYYWRGSESYSSEQKQQRVNQLFKQGLIYYDIFDYKNALPQRINQMMDQSRQNFSPGSSYSWIHLTVGSYLSESDQQEIRNLAATATNTDQVIEAVYTRLSHSEKMAAVVAAINAMTAQLVTAARQDETHFFQRMGMNVAAEQLTPIDWLNILVNIVRGRYEEEPRATPRIVGRGWFMTASELQPAFAYGRLLRSSS
jgi:hypothetical protein